MAEGSNHVGPATGPLVQRRESELDRQSRAVFMRESERALDAEFKRRPPKLPEPIADQWITNFRESYDVVDLTWESARSRARFLLDTASLPQEHVSTIIRYILQMRGHRQKVKVLYYKPIHSIRYGLAESASPELRVTRNIILRRKLRMQERETMSRTRLAALADFFFSHACMYGAGASPDTELQSLEDSLTKSGKGVLYIRLFELLGL